MIDAARPTPLPPLARVLARLAVGLLLAVGLAGCAQLGSTLNLGRASRDQPLSPLPSGRLTVDEIDAQLELAAAELEAELYIEAARRALEVRGARGLAPEQRNRTEELLEQGLRGAAATAERSRDMDRIRPSRLPRRARAVQATAKARLLLDEDKPIEAFETLRALELVHPAHPLRPEAADLVYRAGVDLFESDARLLFFFKRRDRAAGVFDYLVLQHPSYPGCDDAYFRLSELHRDARDLPRAIDRLSDLLVFHPDSPHAFEAESLIPRLRMANQERDDFDYSNLQRARGELEAWLARHASVGPSLAPDPAAGEAGARLESDVRAALSACTANMADARLKVAEFYREVERPQGMRTAALDALTLSNEYGHGGRAERATELLASADSMLQGDALPLSPTTDIDALEEPGDLNFEPTEGVVEPADAAPAGAAREGAQ